jgi:hypothetical protein
MTDCTVMRIDKKAMVEVLHREHAFSDMFVMCSHLKKSGNIFFAQRNTETSTISAALS